MLEAAANPFRSESDALTITSAASDKNFDWTGTLEVARRNRVVGLLSDSLSAQLSHLPEPTVNRIRDVARAIAARALVMSRETVTLAQLFKANGMEVIFFKGAALSQRAYGKIGLRDSSDIDLLIDDSHLDEALALLNDAGYRLVQNFSGKAAKIFRQWDGDYQLTSAQSGLLVELHTHLSTRRHGVVFDTLAVMNRGEHVDLGSGKVNALSTQDLIVYLAVHGAKHHWARLEWLSAFTAVSVNYLNGSFDQLIEVADSIGAKRDILLACVLSQTVFHVPLPPGFVDAASGDEQILRSYADKIAEDFFSGGVDSDKNDTISRLWFNYRMLSRWKDRVRFVQGWIFTPTTEDWNAIHVPELLFPAHRLIRPVRLIGRYATARRRRIASPSTPST